MHGAGLAHAHTHNHGMGMQRGCGAASARTVLLSLREPSMAFQRRALPSSCHLSHSDGTSTTQKIFQWQQWPHNSATSSHSSAGQLLHMLTPWRMRSLQTSGRHDRERVPLAASCSVFPLRCVYVRLTLSAPAVEWLNSMVDSLSLQVTSLLLLLLMGDRCRRRWACSQQNRSVGKQVSMPTQ